MSCVQDTEKQGKVITKIKIIKIMGLQVVAT